MSGLILILSNSQSHVFLLNSRLGLFTAASSPKRGRHPFSRSYRVILPSSLAMNHSSTLGFSPRLPVSVCGTGRLISTFSSFSWKHTWAHYPLCRSIVVLSALSILCGFAYTKYTYRFQRTIPSVRRAYVSPSPLHSIKPVEEY